MATWRWGNGGRRAHIDSGTLNKALCGARVYESVHQGDEPITCRRCDVIQGARDERQRQAAGGVSD